MATKRGRGAKPDDALLGGGRSAAARRGGGGAVPNAPGTSTSRGTTTNVPSVSVPSVSQPQVSVTGTGRVTTTSVARVKPKRTVLGPGTLVTPGGPSARRRRA